MGRKRTKFKDKLTLEQWLEQIKKYGSVTEAAKQNDFTRSYVSLLFTQLADDNPLKIEYNQIKGKAGKKRVKHDVYSDFRKANQQAYYLTYRDKKAKLEEPMSST